MPSGASTGVREALELRDGDKARYGGKGVRKAVANVNGEIAGALEGQDVRPAVARRGDDRARWHADQEPARRQRSARRVDGGGARGGGLAGRAALPHLGALYDKGATLHLLPVPMMNILNGGAHADSQRRLPGIHGDAAGGAVLRRSAAHRRRDFPRAARHPEGERTSTGVGDEGGFAPNLKSNREAVEVVLEAIGKAGLQGRRGRLHRARRRRQRAVGRRRERYTFKKSGEPNRNSDEMVRLYEDWLRHIRSSRSKTAWPKATGTAGSR